MYFILLYTVRFKWQEHVFTFLTKEQRKNTEFDQELHDSLLLNSVCYSKVSKE